MFYFQWNKILLEYFFNHENENKEIYNFYIDQTILNNISTDKNGKEDFVNSIRLKIPRNKRFFDEFSNLYDNSSQKFLLGNQISIKTTPEFFGFLLFLVLALTEGEDDLFNINNVYGRINIYGKAVLQAKWSEINTNVSSKLISKSWGFLSTWANETKKGKLGFYRPITKTSNPFAESIARHALITRGHLSRILDILDDTTVSPGENISDSQLSNILTGNAKEIGFSEYILESIKETSESKNNILSLVREYIYENYTERRKPSAASRNSKIAIPLKIVLNLPSGFSKKIDQIAVRAYSYCKYP